MQASHDGWHAWHSGSRFTNRAHVVATNDPAGHTSTHNGDVALGVCDGVELALLDGLRALDAVADTGDAEGTLVALTLPVQVAVALIVPDPVEVMETVEVMESITVPDDVAVPDTVAVLDAVVVPVSLLDELCDMVVLALEVPVAVALPVAVAVLVVVVDGVDDTEGVEDDPVHHSEPWTAPTVCGRRCLWRSNIAQHGTVQYSTPHHTTRHIGTKHSTTKHSTTRHDTTRHSTGHTQYRAT
jgi:hypothetical protein